jgi:hypothetical protein
MFASLRFATPIIVVSAVTLLNAQNPPVGRDDQVRLATALYERGRYADALRAFRQASASGDAAIARDAQKGVVRTALRVGEFTLARQAADMLAVDDGRWRWRIGDAVGRWSVRRATSNTAGHSQSMRRLRGPVWRGRISGSRSRQADARRNRACHRCIAWRSGIVPCSARCSNA